MLTLYINVLRLSFIAELEKLKHDKDVEKVLPLMQQRSKTIVAYSKRGMV